MPSTSRSLPKLLLDTHALIWWLEDSPRLGPCARDLIADPINQVLFSIVSLWEIAIKARLGKLHIDVELTNRAALSGGLDPLPISPAHLFALRALPTHHNDPFDHLLIAQSMIEGATLVSDDTRIARYDIELITCRDT